MVRKDAIQELKKQLGSRRKDERWDKHFKKSNLDHVESLFWGDRDFRYTVVELRVVISGSSLL